jgi:hypothetical protein
MVRLPERRKGVLTMKLPKRVILVIRFLSVQLILIIE